MKVAAITITYNRLDLTKRTIDSFNKKTRVDYHLFVDNGSTDGTLDYLKAFNRIECGENYGITMAFAIGMQHLEDYDYVLKLDNDVEVITDDLVDKLIWFLERNENYVVSPVDQMIDPNYYPYVFEEKIISDRRVQIVTHTGGAFQIARYKHVKMLCDNFQYFLQGDVGIGGYYRTIGCTPAYLMDYKINHIGLNMSTPKERYVL